MKKRFLSMVLALCMLLSVMPLAPIVTMVAAAAETPVTDNLTFTAIDGTAGNPGENYTNLFDGKNSGAGSTKWCVEDATAGNTYVVIKASQAAVLESYTFITGNDTASHSGRNPKAWTVYGSNDYSESAKTGTWTVVDTVTNGEMPAQNYASKSFSVSSNIAYAYFKIVITEIASTANNTLFQLCGMELSGRVGGGTSEATEKDITLGTSSISGYDDTDGYDYIHYGNWMESAIKWRVLSNSNGKLFLFADYNLFHMIYYMGKTTSITWEKSTIRSWLNGYGASENDAGMDLTSDSFIASYFSNDEQRAIAETYIYNATRSDGTSAPNPQYSTSGGNNTTDKLFLLSIEEVQNSSYFPNGSTDLMTTTNPYEFRTTFWWLRSPGYKGDYAASVNNAGTLQASGENVCSNVNHVAGGVRPAFNLDSSKILFTSAAVGGKAATGTTLSSNAAYTGHEYKLTLLDESRSTFSASLKSVSGSTATVSYSDAKTGTNEYISVVIINGNDVKHYGRVAAATSASGDVTFTLPIDYSTANGDILCVFNEQCNGDKMTDYASPFVVMPEYSWYTANTDATTFIIYTVPELVGFANLVNNTNLPTGIDKPESFSGKTVMLGENIDLSVIANWTPIGTNWSFRGTFDGNGKSISGLMINSKEYRVGLFGEVSRATIQNLAVSGSVTGTGTRCIVGGIVGGELQRGSIKNCSFSGSVTGDGQYVGGIIGSTYGTVSMCSNTATVSGGARYLGGIIGNIDGNVRYCYNRGDVTSNKNDVDAYVGGIVGQVLTGINATLLTVDSCYNTGAVSAAGTSAYIGGAIGYIYASRNIAIEGVYYFDGVASKGIGSTQLRQGITMTGEAVAKSANAFSNGEVAWLLQDAVAEGDGLIWGQTLTGSDKDTYPVFANADGSNKVCKVTFVVDSVSTVKYVNTGAITVADPAAPTGYTFDGWYTAAEGGAKVTGITGDITLYARFIPNSYTLTIKPDNGQADIVRTVKCGADLNLPTNLTKTGYTFDGWSNKPADGKMPANDLTVTAKWSKRSYTLTIKPENGQADIVRTVAYGADLNLPTNLTKTGHAFGGWDGATADNKMPANDLTVTAKWTTNSYTLTIKPENGQADIVRTVKYGDPLNLPTDLTKTGHAFGGWDGATADGKMPANDLTVTAKWTTNSYTLTIKPENGEQDIVRTVKYGDPLNLPTDLTKTGHAFGGWDGATADGKMPANDLTVTAKWTTNSYTLTIKPENGQADIVRTVAYGADLNLPTNLTKTGHAFGGWDGATADGKMPANDLTVTAKWTTNSYTLTIKPENGEQDIVRTVKYGDPLNLPTDLTKTGHTFGGWDGATADGKMPANDLTVTAKWTTNSYKLIFVNGNGEEDTVLTRLYGAKIMPTIARIRPSRTGYRFIGWDGIPADGMMPAHDVTLTATWRKIGLESVTIDPTTDLTLHLTALLSESYAAATLRVTLDGKTVELQPTASATPDVYNFTYTGVTPYTLSHSLTLELVLNDQVIDSRTTSVAEVCVEVAKAQPMLKQTVADLMAFCAATAGYLGYDDTTAAAIRDLMAANGLTASDREVDLTDSKRIGARPAGDTRLMGVGLYFENTTGMYIRFKTSNVSRVTLTVGQTTYTAEDFAQKDWTEFVLYLPGVSLDDLAEVNHVSLCVNGQEIQSMDYAISDYIAVTHKGTGTYSAGIRALTKALYNWKESAEAV